MEDLIMQLEGDVSSEMESKISIANEENQQLQNELIEKRKTLKSVREEAEEQKKRLKFMKEHLDAVMQTVQHNQQLQRALEDELSSEEHLQKLRERETSRTLYETQNKKKVISDLQRKQEAAERMLGDYHKRIDSLLSAVTWEQETTREWLDDAMNHEEDNLVLLKTNQDAERKMKDLGKQLQKMQEECRHWKAAAENAYNNHLNLQQEIMRMANDFNSVHYERERVIGLWEKALREMETRDAELQSLGKEVDSLREKKEAVIAIKKEKEDLLLSEEFNGKELEVELSKLDSGLKGLQKQLDLLREDNKLESEVANLKCEAQGLSLELNSGRGLLKQLEKQFAERSQKLKELRLKGEELERSVGSLREDGFSAERQVELVEANVDQSEKEQDKLLAEEHRLLAVCAKKKERLQELKDEINVLIQTVRSVDILNCKLDQEIKKTSRETGQAETLLNNLSTEKKDLEGRIKKMMGQTKEKDEEGELQVEVEQARNLLAKKKEALAILAQQLQEAQSHIQRTKKDLEKAETEKSQLKQKVEAIELTTENTLRILRKVTNGKQEKCVDKSLLEVNLQKLQQLVNRHALGSESIHKQQMEVEWTVKEQLQKANSCKEMLQLEINMASQERQLLNNDWNVSKSLLEKLRSRYEILLNALPEKDLVEQDPVLLIDRAEQERDLLLKEKKDIEEVLSETQQESEALKNSLKLVEASNSGIRESTKAANGAVEEHNKIEHLEDTMHKLYKEIYERERECRDTQRQIEEASLEWERKQEMSAEKRSLLHNRQRQVENLRETLKTQKERIGRADVQTSRALAASKKMLERGPPKEEVHMDIRLRLFLDLQKRMNCLISEAACQNPEILPTVRFLFDQAKVPIPSLPETRTRKKSDSASSTSSHSSHSGSSKLNLLDFDPNFPDERNASTHVQRK